MPHGRGATRQFLVAEDYRRGGVKPVGALHAAAQIAAVTDVGPVTAAPQPLRQRKPGFARRVADRNDDDGPQRRWRIATQHGEPFDAARPADTGSLPPAHHADQPVIPAAGDDGALGTEFLSGEFESGMTIIIEAAYQTRIQGIGDFQRVESLPDSAEKRPAILVQILFENGCIGDDFPVALVFGIEYSQGIPLKPFPAIG